MPNHRARIRIIQSGGAPRAPRALIRVVFEWSLFQPIPIIRWKNIYSPRSTARIGAKGEGTWFHNPFGETTFSELTQTSSGFFGSDYDNIKIFEFHDIPFMFEFPFQSGMTGSGMYFPYHTAFFHGGIDWEVL
jgi:hypothetical protein